MPSKASAIVVAAFLPLALVACEPSTAVPVAAKLVHVVVTDSSVRIAPASVQAGDVYLVLDEPTSQVVFVQRKASAAETPGPLSADDLRRIGSGDTQFTDIQGFDMAGCTQDERAADRGRLRIPGHCGNVFLIPSLTAGSYALLAMDPAAIPPGTGIPVAVLEVTR